jgi:hypothetical protein
MLLANLERLSQDYESDQLEEGILSQIYYIKYAHYKENMIYVLSEKKLRSLSPNFPHPH